MVATILQEQRIDFKSTTQSLHHFWGLGYISCIQKILLSEKVGVQGPGHPIERPLFIVEKESIDSEHHEKVGLEAEIAANSDYISMDCKICNFIIFFEK